MTAQYVSHCIIIITIQGVSRSSDNVRNLNPVRCVNYNIFSMFHHEQYENFIFIMILTESFNILDFERNKKSIYLTMVFIFIFSSENTFQII